MTPDLTEAPVGPLRLAQLTATDARRLLASNPRLLVPVGTMIARGPHLPLGCDSLVLERLTDDLSAALGIARAPVIPYGVHGHRDPEAPGSVSLTRKTLHRLMNELIAGWETEAKVSDVIILTTHAAEAHLEALSTIRTTGRVTLIDIYAAPLPDDIARLPIETALLMWLAPSLVDRTLIPPAMPRDPDLGERLYRHLLAFATEQIRTLTKS
ncbi:MAG: creatininase family protein [Gemmatimonadetes bacterium]|nr:creatininase family protein [Gemmatimonadota bacterium]MCC7131855.1 creatininase family protein [Gemmatimonadales bacterium]